MASNAARSGDQSQPSSMDDILSSIRQIIAETEARSRHEPEGLVQAPANDTTGSVQRTPSHATEPDEREPTVRANGLSDMDRHDDPSPGDDGGLADVLARLDAEISDQKTRDVPEAMHSAQDPDDRQEEEDAGKMAASDDTEKMARSLSEEDSRAFAAVGNVLTGKVAQREEGSTDHYPPASSQQAMITADATYHDNSAKNAAGLHTLISEEAGAAIAHSFRELDAVFKNMGSKDTEAHIEAILKPMLQEWLDDNLPTMVERLVRAEIERVSRGEPRQA